MIGWRDNAESGALPSGDWHYPGQMEWERRTEKDWRTEPSLSASLQICPDLQGRKKERKEKKKQSNTEGKFQLPDPGTTSSFMLTEHQTEEKLLNCLKMKKRNKEDFLSHSTVFTSRYFVSNCAKRVNVTCSGLALPLAMRLICIHTWKSGLQQGSPAPSFLSLLPSCILARKSALVYPLPLDKSWADHSPPCKCFLQAVYFFLKGCFE